MTTTERAPRWWVRPSGQQSVEVVSEHGEVIAVFYAFDSIENAAKRAALFSKAPEMFDALCDVLNIGRREFSEYGHQEMKGARELLESLRR